LGEVLLTRGENEILVDLSTAVTVGDLQTAFSAAAPDLELRIEGAVLSLVSGSSESFTLENADQTTTASLLGLAGTGTPARLFGVMADLRAALEAQDTAAIRATLSEIAAVEEVVLAELVKVGARQNNLDWAEDYLRQRDERLQADLSREWDADIARVATELNQAEAAYQATLLVTSRLFEANLMMYLR
jgi:flagellin-like hook-associated protein FlgL